MASVPGHTSMAWLQVEVEVGTQPVPIEGHTQLLVEVNPWVRRMAVVVRRMLGKVLRRLARSRIPLSIRLARPWIRELACRGKKMDDCIVCDCVVLVYRKVCKIDDV